MKSANQRYKESGSNMPFKEWLIEEQKKGELDIHDPKAFRNATGDEDTSTKTKIVVEHKSNLKRNLVIGLGLAVCSFGAYHLFKKKND